MKPDDETPETRRTKLRERLLLAVCGLALLAWAFLAAPSWAAASETPQGSPVPADCRQMLLCVGGDWQSPSATLRFFERADAMAPWKAAGVAFPVMLGRNGLGWGLGLNKQTEDGPVKREGDGKAPAGVFALGPAFARDPAELGPNPGMPVLDLRKRLLCVDTPQSRFYNRILPADQAQPKDFDSAEDMLEVGELYRFGLVVDHNGSPVSPGAGSCVFLHIWRAPDKPTAGCTAMAAENLKAVLEKLDRNAHPVLVQLPADQYSRLRSAWALPALD